MPTKDRQRQLARAKLERQMARRAAAAKRRRQTQAAVGAGIALLLVVVGAVFLVAKYGGDDEDTTPSTAAAGPKCTYQKADSSTGKVKDVGLPPTSDVPDTGTRTATLVTNLGTVELTLDQAKAPCTTNSIVYLAGKKFYDNTSCHRMVTASIFVLQCGDPFTDGTGGPAYRYATENLPTNQHPPYPAGTVAMAKSSEAVSVGSQFFIVYKDTDQLGADYTVVGTVTKGLDLVVKAAAKGVTPADASSPNDGKPKQAVKITTFTVSATKG